MCLTDPATERHDGDHDNDPADAARPLSVRPRALTTGLLLAAGAGRRMGVPKALVREPDGTSWLRRSVQGLVDGGCEEVFVVLGAAADEAQPLLRGLSAQVVVADDWAMGLAASLRVGLASVNGRGRVLVSLVDLPDVRADVIARVLASDAALARAAYDERPGHPVLLGANHIAPLMATLHGDLGARAYLTARDVVLIECGDLATGLDVDQR